MTRKTSISTPPLSVASYDEYVGRFVDAVQLSTTDFVSLRIDWIGDCPLLWQRRFADEVADIEWLIRAGAFYRAHVTEPRAVAA